jgi:histidinol phosphatase-like PHP family hydrolase
MTVENIYRRAEELGLTSLGITDHLNQLKFLPEHEKIKRDMAALEAPLEVYFGVELNLLNVEGDLPYSEEVRDQLGFEFAIGGIHSTYLETYDLPRLVEIQHYHHLRFARDPLIDVVVHPWWFSFGEFQQKGFPWFDDLSAVPEEFHVEFAQTAREHGTAIEVNATAIFCNPAYSDRFKAQYREYVRLLMEQGVMLSISSDAHTLSQMGETRVVEELLDDLGLPDEQVWTPFSGKTSRSRLGL